MTKLKWLRDELKNFYIGWVHNPIVTLNNIGVDWINDKQDKLINSYLQSRYGSPTPKLPKGFEVLNLYEEKDGKLVARIKGKKFLIRPLRFEEDLETALKHATKAKRKK